MSPGTCWRRGHGGGDTCQRAVMCHPGAGGPVRVVPLGGRGDGCDALGHPWGVKASLEPGFPPALPKSPRWWWGAVVQPCPLQDGPMPLPGLSPIVGG